MDRKDFWIDFGFSGLTKWCGSPFEFTPLELVVAAADWGEGAYAPTLREDAVRLLESPLPTRVIDILWCAAVGSRFVPDERWIDGRDWLRQIVDVCEERIRRDEPRSHDLAPVTPRDPDLGDLKAAVLAEVRAFGPELARATADHPYLSVPDVVPALERLVTEVDPDLGFRLFLRVLKAYVIYISESQHLRYRELGERFGYHELVVDDGTLQVMPR
ncbi:hypothetical protein [Streptomyces sp. NPDC008141]|uniref:hypothetical protein n=1 Tax=Streptomyces sp. NPDC008141 TaxID=3364815 RepID=UPI0036E257DB